MREGVSDGGVQSTLLKVVLVEGKVPHEKLLVAPVAVPGCLVNQLCTKRNVLMMVIRPTGVEVNCQTGRNSR